MVLPTGDKLSLPPDIPQSIENRVPEIEET